MRASVSCLNKTHLPQPFLISEMLPFPHDLHSPQVDLLQHFLVCFMVSRTGHRTSDVPHQDWVEVQDHLPHLLAVLFLKHPKIPWPQGYCCLMVSLLSIGSPKSFSAELLSRRSVPSLSWCLRLFLLRCRTLHLLCWTSLSPSLPISSACWHLSKGLRNSLGYRPLLPILCHRQTYQGGTHYTFVPKLLWCCRMGIQFQSLTYLFS